MSKKGLFFIRLGLCLGLTLLISCGNDKLTEQRVKDILIKEISRSLDAIAEADEKYINQTDVKKFMDMKDQLIQWLSIDNVKKYKNGYISEVTLIHPSGSYIQFDIKFVKPSSTWQIDQMRMKLPDQISDWMPLAHYFDRAKSYLVIFIHEEKMKIAMADLKKIGTAITSYLLDKYEVPLASSMIDLKSQLEPDHIRNLPVKDPWGNDYIYSFGGAQGDEYAIGCAGRDGAFKGWAQTGTYPLNQIKDCNNDIIFSNGSLTYYPLITNN